MKADRHVFKRESRNAGFSMIEAIVAMVVIGMAAVPITVLISQSMDQLIRVAESNARSAAIESAVAVMAAVNPLDTPEGELDMGDTSLAWRSTVLVPPNENIQMGAGLGGYRIGFYDVEVNIQRNDEAWFSFSLRKMGYERRDVEATLVGGN